MTIITILFKYAKIYVKQPPGFIVNDSECLVCKLDMARLHKASRKLYFELKRVLLSLCFENFNYGNCAHKLQNFRVLLVYTDDIVSKN